MALPSRTQQVGWFLLVTALVVWAIVKLLAAS
jgi:hypothetical protein